MNIILMLLWFFMIMGLLFGGYLIIDSYINKVEITDDCYYNPCLYDTKRCITSDSEECLKLKQIEDEKNI